MAIQPDTTTGTITLVSGSVTFTTSGTNLQTRDHRPGDTIHRNGFTLVIATITGQNSGTLTEACPAAAAGSNVPVRIRYQPDGSRVAAQARALIDLLGSGNAEALAALSGAANRVPYFTGAGAMDVTTLTAFARTLLDDANAGAARSTLELLPVQSATTDATADRLLRTGAFGLGSASLATGSPWPNASLNDLSGVVSGSYFVGLGGGAGGPLPGANNGVMEIWFRYPTQVFQFFHAMNGVSYSRATLNGGDTWSAWGSNIVGTVNQSAGIPTGAIIERGANVNGEYVRFADGTQICYPPAAFTALDGTTSTSVRIVTLTFSSTFISAPKIVINSGAASENDYQDVEYLFAKMGGNAPTSNSAQVAFIYKMKNLNNFAPRVSWVAEGRWF